MVGLSGGRGGAQRGDRARVPVVLSGLVSLVVTGVTRFCDLRLEVDNYVYKLQTEGLVSEKRVLRTARRGPVWGPPSAAR